MAANKEALERLHDVVADTLTQVISEGVATVDKEGNVVKGPAPAAYIANALQLLRQNNIQTRPLPGKPLGNLVEKLPFAGHEALDSDATTH